MKTNNRKVLEYFLNKDLTDYESVLSVFEKFDGAIRGKSALGYPYIYIPGKKENKVLLTAHADTVWQGAKDIKQGLANEKSFYYSDNSNVGIGADDRAGVAMLYLLRNSGHSMLITTGEEKGNKCSEFLSAEEYEMINNHNFIVQLDKCGYKQFKCYNVGSEEFIGFVKKRTGYKYINPSSFTDIVSLCKNVCGVNLSIGYYNEHSPFEALNYNEWSRTLRKVKKLISNTKKFPLTDFEEIYEDEKNTTD